MKEEIFKPEKIRNVAIVAHIDHGKTTIIDALLKQAQTFHENAQTENRMMDMYDLEKERGITIFAKHTSLFYEGHKINLIDTPGHADFSGEVERVLGMVHSIILLIDAQEGPMPQTRFVLSQALKNNLNPIVVVNKIDRPHADPHKALDLTFDLFVELGATDEQLDFAHCFASGLEGYAINDLEETSDNMGALFSMIINKVPTPSGCQESPFLMQASTLSYNDFLGRQATGRILQGKIKKGDPVSLINKKGERENHKIVKIEGYKGLEKVEMDQACVGDIVSLSGMPEVMIGDTIGGVDNDQTLPPIELGEPTLSMDVMVNNGPFVGKDGKHVTMNKIKDRLYREKRANVSLGVEEVEGREDVIRICGRGELHLSILLETLRRESFEFVVSKPQVILQHRDGEVFEPFEVLHIEVPETFSGSIIEELSRRKGELKELATNEHGISSMQFLIPTRGFMGFRNEFLTMTKGKGILTSLFEGYDKHKGELPTRKNGVLISNAKGKSTTYALFNLQDRGEMLIGPQLEVYEGMIIGKHNRDNDLVVNITKEKKLTNVRASGSDEAAILTPHRTFTLEQAIDFIADDEVIEITPSKLRMRKKILSEVDRKRG